MNKTEIHDKLQNIVEKYYFEMATPELYGEMFKEIYTFFLENKIDPYNKTVKIGNDIIFSSEMEIFKKKIMSLRNRKLKEMLHG